MNVVCIKDHNDSRVPLVPEMIQKLKRLSNIDVFVEKSLCDMYSDDEYSAAGAVVVSKEEALQKADILLGVSHPETSVLNQLKPGTLSISFLDVYRNKEYVTQLTKYKVSAISLEMIPRTTLAQKMDALSSQASLAGYVAVTMASHYLNKILPMMMTPAGTIKPAKVFVIGAGVAGLQAIATAKRLGASVTAFDTRPVVKEQVESLGGKFLMIDLGETGQTKDGYAKELTSEQLEIQQREMAKAIQNSDIVITTAKLFGRKAPVIIKKDVVLGMKKGSVIVDLAASTGGNVEGTVVDQVVDVNGVQIIGDKELACRVAKDASIMLSSNMVNLLSHFWDSELGVFTYKEDEILSGCLITKDGEIVHQKIKEMIGG